MTNPYEDLPSDRYWRTGVADHDPFSIENVYIKRFELTKTDQVAVAGSCFAQHVGRNLKERGFSVLDMEPPLEGMSVAVAQRFGLSIYSARYANIYTARQLVQLFRDALSGEVRETDFFTRDGRHYDGLRPNVEPGGYATQEEAMLIRRAHLARVRDMIVQMDVLVFTFGLTEAWRSRADGTVYPVCPGIIAGTFSEDAYEFVNFTYEECKHDFEEVQAIVAKVNPRVRYVVTVSPVPLTATASGKHVLAATTYSKSVLRAVCGALYDAQTGLDYFPSYELITAPFTKGQFFEPNMRSVSAKGVANAMRLFFEAHDPDGKSESDSGAPDAPATRPSPEDTEDDLVCEELLLEAFAKN